MCPGFDAARAKARAAGASRVELPFLPKREFGRGGGYAGRSSAFSRSGSINRLRDDEDDEEGSGDDNDESDEDEDEGRQNHGKGVRFQRRGST